MDTFPTSPAAATEITVLLYPKWMIKSLKLGAEKELGIFTLCFANQASNSARDSET